MRTSSLVFRAALIVIATVPSVAAAQHGSNATTAAKTAPKEASQYDFLVGEWSLTVKPEAVGIVQRMHGVPRLHGTWKATRAADGSGVGDELRILDRSGNTMALTHFTRMYDVSAKHWVITAVDSIRGKTTRSTAEWNGTAMVANAEGADPDGKAFLSRVRITAITPVSFKYVQDRSYDNGASWSEGVLTIDAQRTAPPVAR